MSGIIAYLAAALTHVRLLASVDTLVDRQSRPLYKLFPAIGILAHVGADAAMDAFWEVLVSDAKWSVEGPSSLP